MWRLTEKSAAVTEKENKCPTAQEMFHKSFIFDWKKNKYQTVAKNVWKMSPDDQFFTLQLEFLSLSKPFFTTTTGQNYKETLFEVQGSCDVPLGVTLRHLLIHTVLFLVLSDQH